MVMIDGSLRDDVASFRRSIADLRAALPIQLRLVNRQTKIQVVYEEMGLISITRNFRNYLIRTQAHSLSSSLLSEWAVQSVNVSEFCGTYEQPATSSAIPHTPTPISL